MNAKKRHWGHPHPGTPPGHEESPRAAGSRGWEGRLLAAVAPLARCGGSGRTPRCLTRSLIWGPRCRSGLSTVTALKVLIILSLDLYFRSKVSWNNGVGVSRGGVGSLRVHGCGLTPHWHRCPTSTEFWGIHHLWVSRRLKASTR